MGGQHKGGAQTPNPNDPNQPQPDPNQPQPDDNNGTDNSNDTGDGNPPA
jgi:hypothetical protein